MPVQFQSQRRKLTAFLSGEIDHHSSEGLRKMIDQKVLQDKPAVLCLNFGKVEFMDSSGVGLVMGRYRCLSTYGGKLEICGMSRTVERIMRMSGIENIAAIVSEKGEKK